MQKKSKPKKQETNFKIKKKVRYDSLNPGKAPRVRKELLDADYLDKLSEEELKWYAQFTDEWTAGAVHKTKAGKVKAGYLHNTEALAKSVYDANNWRNNDVLGVSKANNLLRPIQMTAGPGDSDNEVDNVYNTSMVEQAMVAIIDEQDRLDEIKSKELLTEDEHNEMYLTKTEVLRMIRHGAKIPPEMLEFYKKYYKLE
jgi:hypothetical protein